MTDPKQVFYGWFVVAAAFTVTLVGFGSAYSFSAFVESLQKEFGASRGSVALVFSFAGFLYFGLGIITGPLADRWGSRPLAVTGMILTALGLVAASFARNLDEVYVAYGLGVGLGVGCAYVPSLGAVQRWFIKRRGFASGLAVSGIGVGTLVTPPLAAFLIANLGWRHAYLTLGIVAAAIGGGMALLIENNPHSHGLNPDNAPNESVSASAGGGVLLSSTSDPLRALTGAPASVPAGTLTGASISTAIRSRRFLGLYATCLVSSFGLFVPFVHLAPYALDHGVPQSSAVFLVSVIGIGSTAGRFFLGGLADRLGRRPALLMMFVGMALAELVWILSGSWWPLAVFAFTYGVFYGGFVALLPALVMDYFGGRNISGLIGILYTSVGFGTLIGPSAAGFAFDIGHSYAVPILASIGANLVAAVLLATTTSAGAEPLPEM